MLPGNSEAKPTADPVCLEPDSMRSNQTGLDLVARM